MEKGAGVEGFGANSDADPFTRAAKPRPHKQWEAGNRKRGKRWEDAREASDRLYCKGYEKGMIHPEHRIGESRKVDTHDKASLM
jgi:hypothetical protein